MGTHIIGRGRYARETYPLPRPPTGGGGSGGFAPPVDTIARASAARLVDLDATTFPDGTLIFVRSVRDFFVLHKTSALTADDITIADAVGGGQWLRKFTPSVRWMSQASWDIDPSAADDEGDGSAGDPLKTHAELGRRAFSQGREIQQSVVVTIVSTLPDDDPIEIDLNFPASGPFLTIRYVGAPTTIRSGTFDAVTPLDPGSQALQTVTDTVGGSFAGEIRSRVRMTGGAAAGARAWLVRDDGGSTATTSAFWTQAVVGAAAVTVVNPTTDDYVVETFPAVRIARVDMGQGPEGGAFYPLIFEDLDITAPNPDAPSRVTNLDAAIFVGCEIQRLLFEKAESAMVGCLWQNAVAFVNSNVTHLAGAIVGSGYSARGSRFRFANETTAMDVPLISSLVTECGYQMGDASGHDSPSSGVALAPSVIVQLEAQGLLWGDGNASYGINAQGGKLFYDVATQPTITGGTDDTRIGGIDKAYAALPFFNAANGAAVVDTPT